MDQREFQRKLQFIRKVEQGITPDPAWVSRTRETLLMQVGNAVAKEPAPVFLRLREFWQRFVPTQWVDVVRGPVLATLSIFGIVAGGSIVSVSAAEQSLPGDFLYPVKLVSEQTQLIFAKSKSEKLRLKTGFVERRVKEIQAVAASDEPKKTERLKVATDTLRRDLDTVKYQLGEVSDGGIDHDGISLHEVVEAAKLVDKKSTEVVATLKDVKPSLPLESQSRVTEVETAAVATGVKAVQVLIDSHSHPEGQQIITTDELSQSIQGRVQGIEDQLVSTAQKIISANGNGTTTTILTASTTLLALDASTSSAVVPLEQIKNAQQSLEEVKEFLQQNKLEEVKDKLGEAAKAVSAAETGAEVAIAANANAMATTTMAIPPLPDVVSSSSTVSSTSSLPVPQGSSSSSKTPDTKSLKASGG